MVTHPTGREAMDLFNNEIGRRIGADNPDASPEELQQIIKSKIESGEVLVMAPKEGNSSSLGSGVRFQYALEDAVKGNQPTNLDRLAQTAGWTGEWDRVVDLFPGVTAEDLERITGITGMCWKSLPTKDSGSEQQYGYYIFLDGMLLCKRFRGPAISNTSSSAMQESSAATPNWPPPGAG
ncbi:DUF6973 domain-containing protein [Nocardia testacea]|uniref:DUF6973 domain-containing protein n=1 Tax=Nocardia testacea TaxID=248551 RepID=A0ABW7W4N6_9NOCA